MDAAATLHALLGQQLKSDPLLELLEDNDLDVIYHFDRLHENGDDSYVVSAEALGFELMFDAHQVLKTIFCYIKSKDGFTAIDPESIGVPIYRNFDAARRAAKEHQLQFLTPDARKSPGMAGKWLRIDLPTHSIHYEFARDSLSLLTLMLPRP